MKFRIVIAVSACLAAASGDALADPQGDCKAAAGTLLTGVVTSGPRFQPGHPLKGVELSHTHIRLQADQDHRSYDVAIDNVFAAGYDQAGERVPAPLDQLRVGTHLELCGQTYTNGVGIHWVHTNCNQRPTRNAPDGWVRIIGADGVRGDNLESSPEYCSLWGQ
jgi:hypothetical protein